MDLTGVTLDASTYTTMAALGDGTAGAQSLELVAFPDDVTAPAAQVSLRFINASPAASLASADLGTGTLASVPPDPAGDYAALFTGVAFGTASSAPASDAGPVDANGYIAELPLMGATLSVHQTGAAQDIVVAPDDVRVASGAATVALIGDSSAPELLLCADQDDSMQNATVFADCSIVSMMASH
jgi:hypothetical protein